MNSQPLQHGVKYMTISLAEMLRIRYEYEELISQKEFVLPNYNGTINSLEWFLDNGAINNKNNPYLKEATNLAEMLIEANDDYYYENKKARSRR